MYKGSPAPHGGKLTVCLLHENLLEKAKARAAKLPSLSLAPRRWADIEMLGVGAYSPLSGFLGEKEYRSVLDHTRLSNGTIWSIPITLPVSKVDADRLAIGHEIALKGEKDEILAVLRLREKFSPDKKIECEKVFGTSDKMHPGVAATLEAGDVYLAGDVEVLSLPSHREFQNHRLTPTQTRALFAERGWRTVVAFQTRNPIHRAHEYLLKCALETVDGLLVHPLVGATKGDDIPPNVRMSCYEALLKEYFPSNRVVLSVNPANMYYAGPKEAIFHALIRKNYGCTHFIVGRDHAGIGAYYGIYDAQKIFLEYTYGELGIYPLFFEDSFWCKKCGGMASDKTCAHLPDDRVVLSGTKVREMLKAGQRLPEEFSRPAVADVLVNSLKSPAAV